MPNSRKTSKHQIRISTKNLEERRTMSIVGRHLSLENCAPNLILSILYISFDLDSCSVSIFFLLIGEIWFASSWPWPCRNERAYWETLFKIDTPYRPWFRTQKSTWKPWKICSDREDQIVSIWNLRGPLIFLLLVFGMFKVRQSGNA